MLVATLASLAYAPAHRLAASVGRRSEAPACCAAELQYVWLDEPAESPQIGESIQHGDLVVCVPDIASEAELQGLLDAGVAARDAQRARTGKTPITGRFRFEVSGAFGAEVVMTCEEIMLRVLDEIDERMPDVWATLFQPCGEWAARQPRNAQGLQPTVPPPAYLADSCPTLRELYMAGELEWSEGEPAINVYESDGYFGAHKDHLALTVLIPLTPPGAFSGGGTGFWAGNGQTDESPEGPPTTVLKPALGAALVFGGDVTHAGMPVADGLRSVMVASFSTRTPSSPEERVHGLQFATSSSSLREQSRLRHNLS